MRTLAFTAETVTALSSGRAAQRDFQDAVQKSLYVRVGRRTRTFFTMSRVKSKREFKTLGHFPATAIDTAREAAAKQAREWQALREGAQVATPLDIPTLEQCVERHIAESNDLRRRLNRRPLQSADLMRSSLKHHFAKFWLQPVTAITSDVIASTYREIPGRTLACLRAALRIPVGKRLMSDPLIELARGVVGAHGDTALIPELKNDPARIKNVLAAVHSYTSSRDLRVFAEMLLYTGRRPGELRTLRWQDVDLTRGIYVVNSHKAEANKDDAIYAPLSAHLVMLLTAWRIFRDANPRNDARDQYIFPASAADTAAPYLSVTGYRGVSGHIRRTCKFRGFNIYQLKKYFISVSESIGIPTNTAYHLTGHTIPGARGAYSFGIAEMLKSSLERVTTKINEYVNATA